MNILITYISLISDKKNKNQNEQQNQKKQK